MPRSAAQFYAQAVAAFPEHWLRERRAQFKAERWRLIDQITPLGALRSCRCAWCEQVDRSRLRADGPIELSQSGRPWS